MVEFAALSNHSGDRAVLFPVIRSGVTGAAPVSETVVMVSRPSGRDDGEAT
jgi:hypothetical protein